MLVSQPCEASRPPPPGLQVSNHERCRDGDPTSLRILLHIFQHVLLSDSIFAVASPSQSSDFIKRTLCSGLPPKLNRLPLEKARQRVSGVPCKMNPCKPKPQPLKQGPT